MSDNGPIGLWEWGKRECSYVCAHTYDISCVVGCSPPAKKHHYHRLWNIHHCITLNDCSFPPMLNTFNHSKYYYWLCISLFSPNDLIYIFMWTENRLKLATNNEGITATQLVLPSDLELHLTAKRTILCIIWKRVSSSCFVIKVKEKQIYNVFNTKYYVSNGLNLIR